MALTTTTLAADLAVNATKATLTSTTGFVKGQIAQIGGEYAEVGEVVSPTIKLIQRGQNGTTAQAHDLLTLVITGLAADWAAYQMGVDTRRPPFVDDVRFVGENGPIAVPSRDTTIYLNKATALATTVLANPTKDQDGLRLIITSATDAAHVITGVFADGTTGSHTTATYTAFNGASMVLVAQQETWNTVALVAVTIS